MEKYRDLFPSPAACCVPLLTENANSPLVYSVTGTKKGGTYCQCGIPLQLQLHGEKVEL